MEIEGPRAEQTMGERRRKTVSAEDEDNDALNDTDIYQQNNTGYCNMRRSVPQYS